MRTPLILGLAGLLSACAGITPQRDMSVQKRIDAELVAAQTPRPPARPASGPVPPAVTQSLLPSLRSTLPRPATSPEPRFDLIVTDASIGQILHAIVSDTRYSIVLSPRLGAPMPPQATGPQQAPPDPAVQAAAARRDLMTVHLKNATVFEALDAIRNAYGYEYTVTGTRIFVEPPDMQTRIYQVNYTLGQRRGVSDLQVIAGAATSGGNNNGGSGSGGGSSYASNQASAMSSVSKSDVWGEIEDSVRTVLGCQIPKMQTVVRSSTQGSSSSGGSSSRADTTFTGDYLPGERQRGVDGCSEGRAVNVNQMSGTVLVRAMPKELRTIEKLLKTMQVNIERQVIIEAKVIDVQLNRDAQQGINWASLPKGLFRGGVGTDASIIGAPGTPAAQMVASGASLADLLGTGMNSAFQSGLGIALAGSQFAALINFLETQGNVHVLSSPRIATLNNQKAVIKVGTEEPFITAIAPGSASQSTSSTVITPSTLTYQPFFSGISLDVTPQIDERDKVTLHVHALVNTITAKDKASSTQAGSVSVPLAVASVNETDSVIKTADGMMVVIGGLMTESTETNRAAIPGLGDVPVAGALFRKDGQTSSKRELVLLIRPTVVKMESDWTNDIASTGQRIQNLNDRINGTVRD